MSWHSTALYYRLLNEMSEERYGRRMNAESIVVSIPFSPLMAAMEEGDGAWVSGRIAAAAGQAEKAGAACVMLTAFTAHFAADTVRRTIMVPLFDAGDALAEICLERGYARVGLLGTAFTLADGHVAARLDARGIEALLPRDDLAARVDTVIREDLTEGAVTARAGEALDEAVAELAERGAQAVALACTELPLLLPRFAPVPLINGVEAHVAHVLNALEKDI